MTLNTADPAGKNLIQNRQKTNRIFGSLVLVLFVSINAVAFSLYQSGNEKAALRVANDRADKALAESGLLQDERNKLIAQAAAAPAGSAKQVQALGQLVQTASVPIPGRDGAQGVAGKAGSNGSNGLTGTTGAIGPVGLIGPVGETGAIGHIGPAGSIGLTGATGLTGIPGAIGLTGAQGLIGLTGLTGLTGQTGSAGSQGIQGVQGAAGSPGQNAIYPSVLYCTESSAGSLMFICSLTAPIVPTATPTPTPSSTGG